MTQDLFVISFLTGYPVPTYSNLLTFGQISWNLLQYALYLFQIIQDYLFKHAQICWNLFKHANCWSNLLKFADNYYLLMQYTYNEQTHNYGALKIKREYDIPKRLHLGL